MICGEPQPPGLAGEPQQRLHHRQRYHLGVGGGRPAWCRPAGDDPRRPRRCPSRLRLLAFLGALALWFGTSEQAGKDGAAIGASPTTGRTIFAIVAPHSYGMDQQPPARLRPCVCRTNDPIPKAVSLDLSRDRGSSGC